MDSDAADEAAEVLTFDLAQLFDSGFIQVNDQKYAPRLAFVDSKGKVLEGPEKMNFMHEYAASPLDDVDDVTVFKDEA